MFFRFCRQRYWIASLFAARLPFGLAGKKSSSLRSGIFSRQALRKKAIQYFKGPVKSGKHTPMGLFIHS